jgi:hypothetical protein
MAKTLFTRRDVLARGGAAALFLWPVLRSRLARGAEPPPLRLVTFYYGDGPSRSIDKVFPVKSGGIWDWSQATTSAPGLQRHEDYLSIARGTRLNGNVNCAPSPHQVGMLCWTTGATDVANDYVLDGTGEFWLGQHESFDHWYATATGTQATYFAVHPTVSQYSALSYVGPNLPTVAEEDPQDAYDGIFGDLVPGGDYDEFRKATQRRIWVLDAIIGDLKAAKTRFGLSAEESARLERYEATLAQTEADLQALLADGGGIDPDEIPPRPDTTSMSAVPLRYKAFIDITVAALAFDLRRSVAFQASPAYDGAIDYSAFIPGGSTAHHASQHGIGGATGDPSIVTPWIYEQLGLLLDGMRDVLEADGSNLLDNSVVLSGTDTPQGQANHDFAGLDHPTLSFGRAGGRFQGSVDAPAPASGFRDHLDLLATAADPLAQDAGVANPYTQRPGFGALVDAWF